MTTKKRMSGSNRKQAILEAARPLFAHNGFHGTSIRDIAKAADVSEALLYKHFPSKEVMYDEILDYAGAVSETALDRLQDLRPGTEALVIQIYFLVRLILFEVPGLEEQQHLHERLLFRSLLGDTKYARSHFGSIQEMLADSIGACFEAAEKAGDLEENSIEYRNKMWFVHHLAMALNLCHISDKPAFEYDSSRDELADQAVLFCLRGIGMKETAINKHFQPYRLKAIFRENYE